MAEIGRMSPPERDELDRQVKQYNLENFIKDKENGRMPRQALGKNDFLELMMKQLAHQDPLAPMEDKEFIAQMAQFSSLEQMTAMSENFSRLSSDFARVADLISNAEAASALGKPVELVNGENTVQGIVKAVTRGAEPQVLVNGYYYDWEQVTRVFEE
ncbi:MAG: flagellar hook assembly protein FlgD [Treponema sp.]|jgi:flagellar basal-body rod modification protein FlgD|nr:flagellar hook assembly protein FlgD [Treponema sp.]